MGKIVENEYTDNAQFMALVREGDHRAVPMDVGGGGGDGHTEAIYKFGKGGLQPSPGVRSIEETGE